VLDLFGRYVPRAVVNQLMLRPELESLTLGGVVRDVTVLFADIRGFTTFSQDLPPEEVVRELNSLFEVMVECVFENEGTLDKFIGDAILVLFNAPLDQPDHSERAVRTAVAIQQRLASHASGLRVGVGVHRGAAVVGNIGTPQRMEYTAIGSTVNLASRLCDVAKPGEVVVSQQVRAHLSDDYLSESLGPIQVKGISQPLEPFRLVDSASLKAAASA
jgi:adenylate cyclase